jgi:hypothetical protein
MMHYCEPKSDDKNHVAVRRTCKYITIITIVLQIENYSIPNLLQTRFGCATFGALLQLLLLHVGNKMRPEKKLNRGATVF